MDLIIECACGTAIRGSCKQELLASARSHIRHQHPAVGEPPTDEDLIAMAAEDPGGSAPGGLSSDHRGTPA
jgi:predicted small metal-binding protein